MVDCHIVCIGMPMIGATMTAREVVLTTTKAHEAVSAATRLVSEPTGETVVLAISQ